MRRTLAAIVFSALLAVPAFAQLPEIPGGSFSIYGFVGTGATLVRGTLTNGIDPWAANFISGSLQAEARDATDKFGGTVRISAETNAGYETQEGALKLGASAWWSPIVQVKLQLGSIDGFAVSDIVGWGYHANDAEDYVVAAWGGYAGDNFSNTTGFYSGTGQNWTGAALTLSPLYGLDINVGVPLSRGNSNAFKTVFAEEGAGTGLGKEPPLWKDVYLYTSAQVAYSLYGVGKLSLSFAGGGDGKLELFSYDTAGAAPPDYTDSFLIEHSMKANASSVYASFLWNTFPALNANIGFGYTLPVENADYKLTYNPPMEAGLGVSLGYDKYGIKARVGASFLGTASKDGGEAVKEPLKVGFGLLPYYKMGAMAFYLNMSVSYTDYIQLMDRDTGQIFTVKNSSYLGWYVNPYLTIKAGYGTFFAGFRVECDGLMYGKDPSGRWRQDTPRRDANDDFVDSLSGDQVIEWSIPIGIQFEL